jgi:AraC-like DNA-binding protein
MKRVDLASFPPEYANALIGTLTQGLVDENAVLGGLVEAGIANGHIRLRDLERIVRAAIRLLDEPALGLRLASRLNIGHHGDVGYIAMSSPDVQTAIERAFRYAGLRTGWVSMTFRFDGEYGLLELASSTNCSETQRFLAEMGIYCCFDAVRFCLGGQVSGFMFEFSHPRPEYASIYENTFEGDIRFGADATRLLIPKETLARPVTSADPRLAAIVEQSCESKMRQLDSGKRYRTQVRTKLLLATGGFPSQEEIAKALGVTPRTLRNYLRQEGTTYRALAEDSRRELARQYLTESSLTTGRIAELLGYSAPTHFARAFRRWFGQSPAAYRTERAPSDGQD